MSAVEGKHTGVGSVIFIVCKEGAEFMVTSAEDGELQPAEFVTMKLNLPVLRPVMVVVVPVPGNSDPSGDLVIVHLSPAGNPFNTTLPVCNRQVG